MASQGYRDWVKAGKPYTLIRPAVALQRRLRAYGLTVYDYPNDDHLLADPPEDHTPFSATGWPGANRRWNARALDVMPRTDTKAGRKENADIARQLIRDRDAGVAGVMWIKYVNWTDEQGTCQQERWTDPNNARRRTTRSSTDRGHIHISGRSDVDDDARAENYDPIARMTGRGADMPLTSDERRVLDNIERYVIDGVLRQRPTIVGKGQAGEDYPVTNQLKTAIDSAASEVVLSDAQLDLLADKVLDRLGAKLGEMLIAALTDPRAIDAYRQGADAAEDS